MNIAPEGLSGNISLERFSSIDEPPLLEDLGIDIEHIQQKIKSVITLSKLDDKLLAEPDMGGPLLFAIIFGFLLLMAGKLHFSYIYGFGMIGSIGIYLMMNLMAQEREIDLYKTISILGYCILPIILLAAFGVFIGLQSALGGVFGTLTILWSTFIAS